MLAFELFGERRGRISLTGDVAERYRNLAVSIGFWHDETDLHPARVLQARREEVYSPLPTVEVPHVNVAEVVLRELAGEALEPDHRPSWLGRQLLDRRGQAYRKRSFGPRCRS